MVGFLVMLGLSYFATARLSSRMSKVIDAIRLLARKDREPPELTNLVQLQAKEHGDIKVLADAVLDFRAALVERSIAESEMRIAATAFESQESLMITDADGVILRVNQAFTESTGYTAEEVVGQTPRLLKSGRHNADFYRAMWETIHRLENGREKSGIDARMVRSIQNGSPSQPSRVTMGSSPIMSDHTSILQNARQQKKKSSIWHSMTTLPTCPTGGFLLDRLQQALASSARSGRSRCTVVH